MPHDVRDAVVAATEDPTVKVIVLRGTGRAFCAGYDFAGGFRHWNEYITTDGQWDPGKNFRLVSGRLTSATEKFMSIWRTHKPVIAPGPRLVRRRRE